MPLTTLFRGDFVVQLVAVTDSDSMDTVCREGRRAGDRAASAGGAPGPMRVDFGGTVLPRETTVAAAGIGPMDFVEVFYE